ncbi:MAG: serine protease [Pseudomonadota bacterium]
MPAGPRLVVCLIAVWIALLPSAAFAVNTADPKAASTVQNALVWAGHLDGPVDGIFGPQSRKAVQAFQRTIGHAATGRLERDQLRTLMGKARAERLRARWRISHDDVAGLSYGLPTAQLRLSKHRNNLGGRTYQAPKRRMVLTSFALPGRGASALKSFMTLANERAGTRPRHHRLTKKTVKARWRLDGKTIFATGVLKDGDVRGVFVELSDAHARTLRPQVIALLNSVETGKKARPFMRRPLPRRDWAGPEPTPELPQREAPDARREERPITVVVNTPPPAAAAPAAAEPQEFKKAHGTAVALTDKGVFLTTTRLIAPCQAITVDPLGRADVIAFDGRLGLALLAVEGAMPEGVAPIANDEPRLAEPALAFNFPPGTALGSDLAVAPGNIAALAGPRGTGEMLRASTDLSDGTAGGPLLDASGRMLGLMSRPLNAKPPKSAAFAVQAWVLRAFLKTHKIDATIVPRGADAKPAHAVAADAARFTYRLLCH